MVSSATRPILVVNPAEDEAFGAFARVLVNHGASTTDELERRLRPLYANAVVHARELSSEPLVIWYVYRDGQWVKSRGGTDPSDSTRMSDARRPR